LEAVPLVAVVDDDQSLRTALSALIRSLGIRVRVFASAELLLADVALNPDCVISDIQMPGMSGIDLIAALQARQGRIPVILMTAREERALLSSATSCGALAVLRKPFAPEALLESLGRALDLKL